MKSLENDIRQIMFESEKKKREATQAAYDAAAARNNPTEFVKKQQEAQKKAAKVAKHGLTPEGGNSIPEEKDEGEYGYEGDMAITQLKTIVRHCNDLISKLKPEEDLPEWVQSKITLATDYIQTASDYLNSVSEEVEQVDENIYGIKPTSVDKGIAAASDEYIRRKKEGTLPKFKPEPPKKPSPEQEAKYQAWLKKKEGQEAREKEAARKPKTEEVQQVDEISAKLAKSYLDAQDRELASGKVATEGPRKSRNRMVGYSRAKERLTKEDVENVDEGILGTIGNAAKATVKSAVSKLARSATPGLYSAYKDIKARTQNYNDSDRRKEIEKQRQERQAEREKATAERIAAKNAATAQRLAAKKAAVKSAVAAKKAAAKKAAAKKPPVKKPVVKKAPVKKAPPRKTAQQQRRTSALSKPAGMYNKLREELGAGEIGTAQLVKKYIKDTPGQEVNTTNRTSFEKLHKYLQIKHKIIDEA